MKRFISLTLAIVMIFALMSTMAFAADNKTDALLSKVANATEMQVTVRSGDTAMGSSATTYYIKGNAAAYEFTNGFFKVRVVYRDGNVYAYLPILPFFYAKLTNTGLVKLDIPALLKSAMGLTKTITVYEGAAEETIDGVTYYVETYNDRAQAVLKYCYTGDELKLLKVTNRTGTAAESVQYTYFDSYSFSVSDSIVAVPTGIDVSPLFKTLFLGMLASAV